MNMNPFRCLALAALFAVLCFTLSAQSDSGAIVGFVKDPSGAVVPKSEGEPKQ